MRWRYGRMKGSPLNVNILEILAQVQIVFSQFLSILVVCRLTKKVLGRSGRTQKLV